MLNGVFITGTDTNIGKTVVAAALMQRYRHLGTLRYWKPIQTGIEQDDDTATVRHLGDCPEAELFPLGVRLQRPLAPYLAAELSGTRIGISDVEQYVKEEAGAIRWVVEGAGGVLVPINETEFMIDLMVSLSMPVLVVTGAALGTINQTLLTLEALRHRSLDVAGVIMVGDRNRGNRDAIEQYGAVSVLAEMPRFSSLTPETLSQWAALEFDPESRLASCLQ